MKHKQGTVFLLKLKTQKHIKKEYYSFKFNFYIGDQDNKNIFALLLSYEKLWDSKVRRTQNMLPSREPYKLEFIILKIKTDK